MSVHEPLVIGLGGNVGTPAEIVERFGRAREALAALATGPVRSAPLFRTAPFGPAQPDYLNSAVCFGWPDGQPGELMAAVGEIERLLGRRRSAETRWGPRPIDLDVLVWGARVVRTAELEVPHPRLAERRFALAPLAVLVGDAFAVPGAGAVGALLQRVAAQHCEAIAETW